MNYLAHAYLSFNQPEVLLGNMISDYVKGKKKFDYPLLIQQGIGLHRSIDNFTDFHSATAEAKTVFRPSVGLYSGAFVDVVYDHFLALDTERFTDTSLRSFAAGCYLDLNKYESLMPGKFAVMFPYMKQHDWLYNYQYTWAIQRSFAGLAARATYLNHDNEGYAIFLSHYDFLKQCYERFMPDVYQFAAGIFATFDC